MAFWNTKDQRSQETVSLDTVLMPAMAQEKLNALRIDELIALMREALFRGQAADEEGRIRYVDKASLSQYLDRLEQAIPEEVRRAHRIIADRDSIIARANEYMENQKSAAQSLIDGAKAEAQRVIGKAEAEADKKHDEAVAKYRRAVDEGKKVALEMVARDEITARARQEADALLADARSRADAACNRSAEIVRQTFIGLRSELEGIGVGLQNQENAILGKLSGDVRSADPGKQ